MRTWKMIAASLAATAVAAAPAWAQDRNRRTAEEIAREIREAAEAIGTVRDAVDDSVNGVRFRGRDRYAIDRCAPSVERYGRMRVDDVRRHGRRSLRVYGTVDAGRYDDRYGDRYRDRDRDRYGDRYTSRYRYGDRAFTCTVRDDGRVKVKTRRLRR
jgi:hypothetical protein